MARHQIQNIEVTEAGRAWASGTVNVDGCDVRWEAYRKNESTIRVMLAQDGRWINPGMGAVRIAVDPIARRAMQ